MHNCGDIMNLGTPELRREKGLNIYNKVAKKLTINRSPHSWVCIIKVSLLKRKK